MLVTFEKWILIKVKKSNIHISIIQKLTLVLGWILVGQTVFAQKTYNLSLEGNYVVGTNGRSLFLQDNEINAGTFHGSEWNLVHDFNTKFHRVIPSVKTGFRHLHSTGDINGVAFNVRTVRMNLNLGAHINISDQWRAALYYGIENNIDVVDFITQAPDLFRHSMIIDVRYRINRSWNVGLSYQRAMSPLVDHYFVTNPKSLVKAGIVFRLL